MKTLKYLTLIALTLISVEALADFSFFTPMHLVGTYNTSIAHTSSSTYLVGTGTVITHGAASVGGNVTGINPIAIAQSNITAINGFVTPSSYAITSGTGAGVAQSYIFYNNALVQQSTYPIK